MQEDNATLMRGLQRMRLEMAQLGQASGVSIPAEDPEISHMSSTRPQKVQTHARLLPVSAHSVQPPKVLCYSVVCQHGLAKRTSIHCTSVGSFPALLPFVAEAVSRYTLTRCMLGCSSQITGMLYTLGLAASLLCLHQTRHHTACQP